jgi:ATP-dependent DNA helicase RecQ
MRVPGFPEMLAKRKPTLVAIDEAHCISAWGHDFRPDYRTLGQYLPALRPAPILALTATATPTVQRDILKQLDLQEPAVFITGFRRQNLAVEVVELSKPQRPEFALKLLKEPGARPAIVYAGSRKQAEEFASALHKHFPTAAYHAGLDAGTRDRVQRAFLGGKLECVVATVAFGMGVDKADVRTVVHVALPGSIEAYYQEIGRAGRDGKPSRTVLLHGFADRRLQEFFLEKNYPPTSELETVARLLKDEFVAVDALVKPSRLDRDTLDTAIEKLLATGVAVMDMAGDVRLVPGQSGAGWKSGYEAQVANRRAQIDRMVGFAESNECRMRMLVQHFGDTSDTARSCGLCDVCNPAGSGSANAAHQPTAEERGWLRTILRALEGRSTSTGKLFTDTALMKERKDFDVLLEALARAGLIVLANDSFTGAEGKEITYKKASITHEGREPDDATLDTVWIRGNVSAAPAKKKARARSSGTGAAPAERVEMHPQAEAMFERLRAWRTEVARPTKTPAFMILGDAVLRGIAARGPKTLAELHTVSGMGPAKVERYGAAVLAVCWGETVAAAPVPRQEAVARTHVSEARHGAPGVRVGVSASAVQVKPKVVAAVAVVELNEGQRVLEERLKVWRKAEAAKAGLPSFLVLSDTVVREIALAGPRSLEALSGVRGVGVEKVERFGEAVVGLCRG